MNSHIAIFGNTGSGKSNTLATLYQHFVTELRAINAQRSTRIVESWCSTSTANTRMRIVSLMTKQSTISRPETTKGTEFRWATPDCWTLKCCP